MEKKSKNQDFHYISDINLSKVCREIMENEDKLCGQLRDEYSHSNDLERVKEVRSELEKRLPWLGYSNEEIKTYFAFVDSIRLKRGQDILYDIGE